MPYPCDQSYSYAGMLVGLPPLTVTVIVSSSRTMTLTLWPEADARMITSFVRTAPSTCGHVQTRPRADMAHMQTRARADVAHEPRAVNGHDTRVVCRLAHVPRAVKRRASRVQQRGERAAWRARSRGRALFHRRPPAQHVTHEGLHLDFVRRAATTGALRHLGKRVQPFAREDHWLGASEVVDVWDPFHPARGERGVASVTKRWPVD